VVSCVKLAPRGRWPAERKEAPLSDLEHHSYRVALLPGDGIGPEVTSEAQRLLELVSQLEPTVTFDIESFPWNADFYLETGAMMPENGLEILCQFDAIYLGAVGDLRVPDHIALRELIFAIRQGFDQYVNLRPVRLLQGGSTPLAHRGPADLNMIFVRENSEGEYSGVGETLFPDTADEVALQTSVFSRKGVERILRYGFEMARTRGLPLQSISKGNALNYSGVLWDRIFFEMSALYPDVEATNLLVDAAALHMVLHPEKFGVVVASNLFGDILTDLGAALVGGLGFAASANLCPDKRFPSMFEPVHGSAPDIAGKGVANPCAALWAAGMLLGHLDLPSWEEAVINAIEQVLVDGQVATPDLGGSATTSQMSDAVLDVLRARMTPLPSV
jgi:tartrate dehydrogenase/decarboxylase / D-malate dehydrogenase